MMKIFQNILDILNQLDRIRYKLCNKKKNKLRKYQFTFSKSTEKECLIYQRLQRGKISLKS